MHDPQSCPFNIMESIFSQQVSLMKLCNRQNNVAMVGLVVLLNQSLKLGRAGTNILCAGTAQCCYLDRYFRINKLLHYKYRI